MIKEVNKLSYQFLRKTQKYTGTDNVYLAKGGFWLTLGQFVSAGASLLLAIAFANLLDPVTYGNYKYALSLFGILQIFSLIGMKTAITQAVARGLEGSFYTGFKARLKWALLGSLVGIAAACYYWLRGNETLPIPLLLSAAFLPLMYASRVYVSFLDGKKLFNIRTKYNIVSQIAFAVSIVAALFLTKNLVWLIAVYLVSHTFLNYFFYFLTKIRFKPNKNEDPKTLNYGKHLSLMGVISQSATYLDKILMFTLVGSSQLAIYAFAIIVPEEVKKILGSISTLAMPKFSPKSREEIKVNIMKKFWKLALLTGVVAILYVLIAPYFYQLLFPQYMESVWYSQIFILSFISIPVSLLGVAFQAKMMKKELYLIKIAPFIRIGLFAVFIPFYGILGAIMAIIGAELFKLILVLFLFRRF